MGSPLEGEERPWGDGPRAVGGKRAPSMAGQRGGKSLLGPLARALQLLSPPGMLSVRTSHGPLMCRQAVKAAGKSSGMFVGTSEMGNCR